MEQGRKSFAESFQILAKAMYRNDPRDIEKIYEMYAQSKLHRPLSETEKQNVKQYAESLFKEE